MEIATVLTHPSTQLLVMAQNKNEVSCCITLVSLSMHLQFSIIVNQISFIKLILLLKFHQNVCFPRKSLTDKYSLTFSGGL